MTDESDTSTASNTANLEVPNHATLETERLHLRTFYVSDAEAMLPIISHSAIMQWTSQQTPITELPAAEKWASDRALGKNVFNFLMFIKTSPEGQHDESKPIGIIGSRFFPEVGYLVHPDYHRKGYASEALRAIIPAMFDRMPAGDGGFNYVEAATYRDNLPSQGVMEKCGLTFCSSSLEEVVHARNPGLRTDVEIVAYRVARPGYELKGLEVVKKDDATRSGTIEPVVPLLES